MANGAPLLTEERIAALLPPRRADCHKGDNGRVLLCAGSERYTGTAVLAAAAALRAGCGLLEVCTPRAGKPYFAALPEACCTPVGSGGAWDEAALSEACARIPGRQALAFGCGMDQMANDTLAAAMLQEKKPLAIDADGLNHLAKHRSLLSLLHENTVLTPHPAEFSRLSGLSVDEICQDPATAAKRFADRYGCTVLLKGAVTQIASPVEAAQNAAGNPGLAKGGSGDVLTGLITGLLAQGLRPFDAACAGAYLLGASADTALTLLGTRMLAAGDVVSAVKQTLWRLSVDPRDPV